MGESWRRHLLSLDERTDSGRRQAVAGLSDAWALGEVDRFVIEAEVAAAVIEVGERRVAGLNLVETLHQEDPIGVVGLTALAGSGCDPQVVDTAQMRLGNLGATSAAMLGGMFGLLESDVSALRGGAVVGLSQARAEGADIRGAVEKIASLAPDDEISPKAAWQVGWVLASHAIEHIEEKQAADHVVQVLKAAPKVIQPARGAMSRIERGPTRLAVLVREAVAPLVKHKSKPVWESAATVLGIGQLLAGDQEGFAVLLARKKTRRRAAYAMRQAATALPVDPWEGVAQALLSDSDGYIRSTAEAAIQLLRG